MRILPIENEVLCEKLKPVSITKGGILIAPTPLRDNSNVYKVLAISKQVQDMNVLSAGSIVIVSNEVITGFKFGSEECYFIDIKDVLAILGG